MSAVNYFDTDPVFTIVPNAADKSADIFNSSEDVSAALLKVVDLDERVVMEREIICAKGNNVSCVDLPSQAKGMYLVTLFMNGKLQTSKLV